MLVGAKLSHVAGTKPGAGVCLDMQHFRPFEQVAQANATG